MVMEAPGGLSERRFETACPGFSLFLGSDDGSAWPGWIEESWVSSWSFRSNGSPPLQE